MSSHVGALGEDEGGGASGVAGVTRDHGHREAMEWFRSRVSRCQTPRYLLQNALV